VAKTYYTFRIRLANDQLVRVEKWNDRPELRGEPSRPFRYKEKLELITPLLQPVLSNELNNSQQARKLGEALFEAIFDEVLCQEFLNFYQEAVRDKKQLLRIELDVDEQTIPEVAVLPWEFMCLPAAANLGDRWLGTDPNIVFSRRRALWNPAPPIQLEKGEKLRIALAISAPKDLGIVKYEEVQEALENLAKEQAERIELLPIVNPATPSAIDRLLEQKPHIFHFIGHGQMQNEAGEEGGQIALMQKVFNTALWMDAGSFSELFNRWSPGVVLLQACESGMLSASKAFAGVASKIVQMNIPVVVAMQYEVSNITASQFAYEFYERLAKGEPVDIAAQNGRRSIALNTHYRKRDFATPVIFMRVRDGYLFSHQEVEAESEQSTDQPIGKNNARIPTNLPRSGVVAFVGRDTVMSELHQILQQGHRVAVSAIAGMGGVGKTELALQYALNYQQMYPAGICWFSARGVDVGTQIVKFGRSLLDLNPPEDLELLDQVKFCWGHWQSGEVLLVFDDVTDYGAIKPYLPPSTAPSFKVLITTRLRLGASVNQLELEVLDESAALSLLESLVGSDRIQSDRDSAQQLCAQLGYLPLGLELVGRYLARKPDDLSLAAMLQRLQEKRLAARALCQTDDDMTAQLGVAAAFELSWETLSESAKSLGYLLSLFAAAPIPWFLVKQFLADQDPEILEETRDNELLNLHLLQQTNPGTYRLHPLIRDFFQTKSFAYQIVDYSEAFDRLWKLRNQLKQGGHWPLLRVVCEKLLPFVEEGKKASCLIVLGDIYLELGDLEEAERHFQNAISIAQAQGTETDVELCSLQLQLINIIRQQDILAEISFNSKAEYKRLYPNPSELTGFDFWEFLADGNRQNAALTADTQRKILETQRQHYRNFVAEHGESDLADTTFLPQIGETLVKLGDAELNAGNLEIAGKILQEALEIVNNRGMMKHIALTNYHLARLERFLHNMDLAQTYYDCACKILQSLGAVKDLKRIQQDWERMMDERNR
jgi:tetratricopeptide (TPR) repeat protein